MKTLFIITSLICIYHASARTTCDWGYLYVYTSGKNIRQNPVFIIEGYLNSQEFITELNKKYRVYLQAGNEKIKLSVREILKGEMHLTQAVLVPEKILEAGLDYTLYIDSLPNRFRRFDGSGDFRPQAFRVIKGLDVEKPVIMAAPKEAGKRFSTVWGSNVANVFFDYQCTDSSDVYIKTTVRSMQSGKETTYYLQPHENKIVVGYNMCAGAFTFNQGDDYEVAFSFMDHSGNETPMTGDKIKFSKPIRPLLVKNH